ncbi:MAG: two-component regulator propeller domain-containing protein, partial [Bacteroidota bacterium]
DSSQTSDQRIPQAMQALGYAQVKTIEREDFGKLQQQRAHVTSMSHAPDGSVWLSTSFGLYRYSYASDRLVYHSRQSLGIPSQGLNALLCVYQDAHGLLWMGSIEGLAKPADRQAAFRSLVPAGDGPSLVKAIEVDPYGQRWLGIENGGIQVFAPGEDQPYLQIKLSGPYSGLNYDFVMDLHQDRQGQLWVATYGGGVHRLRLERDESGRVTSYENQAFLPRPDGKGLRSYYYYSLLEADDGRMWLGSFDDVGYFDDELNEFRGFKVPVANFLLQDQSHHLWIATDEGLYRYVAEKDTLEKVDLLDEAGKSHRPRIECLAVTLDGKLWAATLKGLLEVNPETGRFRAWTRADGLPHDQVVGLTVDQSGELWASTLLGIVRVGESPLRVFRQAQGLRNESFSTRASSADEQGNLYFGGKRGLDYFRVSELRPPPEVSSLALTHLRIFNQRVAVGDSLETGLVLPKPLNQLTQLNLSHRERMVGFEFAGLGFRQSQSYRYAYQLEGFDENWRETEATQRLATYTNLPPGKYTFRVRVAAYGGAWEAQEVALAVLVAPPWWNSPWAWFTYALLGGILAWLLIRFRLRTLRREWVVQQRISEAKAEEREQVRARSARDFHDEAGGQLTKLALYTGLIRRQT